MFYIAFIYSNIINLSFTTINFHIEENNNLINRQPVAIKIKITKYKQSEMRVIKPSRGLIKLLTLVCDIKNYE